MIDKPQDLAIILGLASFAIVLGGIGVASINGFGADVDNTMYMSIQNSTLSQTGLKGASDYSLASLSSKEGESAEQTQASLLRQGFTGLLNIGGIWGTAWSGLNDVARKLGIPAEFIIILGSMIAISFVVVLYTWLRTS